MYDADGALLSDAAAPVRRRCAGTSCWKARPAGGFRYRDPQARSGGVVLLRLAPGKRGGIALRGRGPDLTLPPMPIAGQPVIAQLRRDDDDARCWESAFGPADANGAKRFRAALP